MKNINFVNIQVIKKNDKLLSQLSDLEKILDQIYDRYTKTNSQTYRKCIFPEIENDNGEIMSPEEFFEMIYQFIEKSEINLKKDSAKLLN